MRTEFENGDGVVAFPLARQKRKQKLEEKQAREEHGLEQLEKIAAFIEDAMTRFLPETPGKPIVDLTLSSPEAPSKIVLRIDDNGKVIDVSDEPIPILTSRRKTMRISSAFPSKYLRAADLQDRQVKVLMSRVETETIGDDDRPVLYFQGKEKGLVLNKTNANSISAVYGDDTEDWRGGEIVLFQTMVDFQGKTMAAIRCRALARNPEPEGGELDDEIPF